MATSIPRAAKGYPMSLSRYLNPYMYPVLFHGVSVSQYNSHSLTRTQWSPPTSRHTSRNVGEVRFLCS